MWVLLHGFTGSPRSWDPVVARLPEASSALRPTLYGHGFGWRDLRVSAFEDEVERLCDLSSRTSRPRFLGGYSLGARIAAAMLAASPGMFDGALLVGVHPGLTSEADRRARHQADEEKARELETKGLEAFVRSWEAQPMFDTQRRLPETILAAQRRVRLDHDPEGLAAAMRTLGLSQMPPYGEALRRIDIPTTLMVGELDSKFRSLASELAARSERLDLIVVKGAGHNPVLEASDAVAAALRGIEQQALAGAER